MSTFPKSIAGLVAIWQQVDQYYQSGQIDNATLEIASNIEKAVALLQAADRNEAHAQLLLAIRLWQEEHLLPLNSREEHVLAMFGSVLTYLQADI